MIDRLAHQFAVDSVLESRADCLNFICVPIVLVDQFRQLGSIADLGRLFFPISVDRQLFAALAQNAAAALFVQDSGVPVIAIHIGLIATDDPLLGVDYLAAIL